MGKRGWSCAAAILMVTLAGCSFQETIDTSGTVNAQEAIDTETVAVLLTLDGDTSRLEDDRDVRYLGINAPEKGCPHAEDAGPANERLVRGKTVRLEFGRSRQDKYGRLLAYVFVDGIFVNETLLRQGLVHLHPEEGKYRDRLQRAQEEARAAGAGIWTPSATGRSIALASIHENAEGDDRQNLNDEYIVIENQGRDPVDLSGWVVSDAVKCRYRFPNFILAPKAKVTLRTGSGTPTETDLFIGSRTPIWNNDGDTIYISDAQGHMVLYHMYRN